MITIIINKNKNPKPETKRKAQVGTDGLDPLCAQRVSSAWKE